MTADLRLLADPAFAPLFWPLARTGVPSAWITHVPFAHWLVTAHRPRSIVELGTHNGVSYAAFCEAVQRGGLDCRCLAVDTWKGDEHADFYGEEVYASLSAFHAARYGSFSELLRATFDDALRFVPDGSVDLLHIDGLHTYEAVRHDYETWLPKLSPRAVVLMHDTNVREREFGVWRLFAEVSAGCPSFEFLHGHGLGVLAPGSEPGAAIAALAGLDGAAANAVREGFSLLGERWRGPMVLDAMQAQAAKQQAEAAAHLAAKASEAAASRTEAAASIAALEHRVAAARDAAQQETLAARGAVDRAAARHASESAALQARLEAQAGLTEAYRQAGEHIANLEALLDQARKDRDDRASERDHARHELHVVRSSTASRATFPARALARRTPAPIKRLLRRGARLAWWTATLRLPQRLRERRALLAIAVPTPRPEVVAAPEPAALPAPTPAIDPPPDPRQIPVDIVICVHDALESLGDCIASVLRCTMPPYRVILVDDGSGAATAAYLDDQVREQGFTLHRNAAALGYTKAANIGLRATTAPWVVLLNSDTVVTAGWLDRMRAHAAADPDLGVLGPLSNTASWQSVPRIFEPGGDWATNELPQGVDIEGMARLVAANGIGAVPLPFINGFCLMLRRAVIEGVGLFDEDTFGAGYGEENDYAIRVRAGGWGLAVASDTYVFHAQSMSYSGRRAELAKQADTLLIRKHDPVLHIWPQAALCRDSLPLAALRARAAAALETRGVLAEGRRRFEERHVAVILPIAERGGGGNVVLQESRALLRMGVSVTMLTLDAAYAVLGAIPELAGLVVRSFPSPEAMTAHLVTEAGRYDAVLATLYRTVYWLPPDPAFVTGYYIQDWEPLFFADQPAERDAALASYTTRPELRLVTKTEWNRNQVLRHTGRDPAVLGPSVDTAAFAPAANRPAGKIRIVAMLRPSTPRRAPERTVAVLARVVQAAGNRIEVHVFGTDPAELRQAGLHRDWATSHGKLDQVALASLLGGSDLFLDCSDYQAMGLTALEAMLAGCAVVGPREGGADSFIRSGDTGILVDTADEAACATALLALIDDPAELLRIRQNAIAEANRHGPAGAALRLMAALFDA